MPRAAGRHRRGREAAEAAAPVYWGHWVALCLVTGGLIISLFIQRELAAQPAAAAADPAPRTLPGPVLAPRTGAPVALPAQPGTISLIFDGGSGQDVTPRIVSALRELAVPATFFVQGNQVAAGAPMIRRELSAGDDVGMTGFSGMPIARMTSFRLNVELTEAQDALVAAGDPDTALVRPPGATTVRGLTPGVAAAALRLEHLGYVVVLADRSASAANSPAAVLSAAGLGGPKAGWPSAGTKPGIVLALSDTGQPGRAALAALPLLAADLRGHGYIFTTITKAFRLSVQPAKLPALMAASERAMLATQPVAAVARTLLRWTFATAAGLLAFRLALLVTVGGWHKLRDRRSIPAFQDLVSVIIPAYNESAGIERCLRSILDNGYPRLQVILVDDGSTDSTAEIAEAFGSEVIVARQPNSGKAAALNTGIRNASADVLVLVDGDTIFEHDTIIELVAPFRDRSVGAVSGNVKVANRSGLLGLIQHTEYEVASSLERRMYDVFGCMVTIPGAVGAFRRSAIVDVGGVPTDTLAEDTDLTIAIGRAGWRVRFAAHARAWTEAPSTVPQLWRQRHRWSYGTFQALWKHRRAVISPGASYRMAWIGLPYLFVVGCVLPVISPATDLYILITAWTAPWHALDLVAALGLAQGTLTLFAFVFDRERLRYLLPTLPFQLVFYRQLLYLVVFHSMATAFTGVRLRWHKLNRTGIEVLRA